MQPKNTPSQPESEEEMAITLPATALETLAAPLSGQLNSGHGAIEGKSSIMAASAMRDEPFPCFKRSAWDERIVVKVVRQPASSAV